MRVTRIVLLALMLSALFAWPVRTGAQDLAVGTPVSTPAFDGEFTDVSGYWGLAWSDDWAVTSYSSVDYGELLQLSDANWTVRLQGPIYDPLTDSTVIPGDARSALVDLARAIGVEYPLFTEAGRPIQHFSKSRAWRVYLNTNGDPIYLDVRALDDSGAFLYILAWVDGGTPVFNENYQHMLLLLENIRLLKT
jgi:hypothetical protein